MKGRHTIQRLALLLWSCGMLLWGKQGFAQQPKSSFNKTQATPAEQQIRKVCTQLDKALQTGDTVQLKALLHPQLSLGHSNGLIETREELLAHLSSGFLKYNKITEEAYTSIQFVRDMASVRRNLKVSGALQGNTFEVRLKVLEVWFKENKRWRLWCRQSVKQQ